MQINIKTSEKNKEIVRSLTYRLGISAGENVIARIALAYSLKSDKKFEPSDTQLYDSKGKEYKDHILFDAKYRDFYIALVCQHYNLYKTDEMIRAYVKLHIDHGLELIAKQFEQSRNFTFFDFLELNLNKGIADLDTSDSIPGATSNMHQKIEKPSSNDLIQIQVGSSSESGEGIFFDFNDASIYNNNHIAVAGNSGTGKTQFALDLLSQISKNSNQNVNFIYLDFKGLKDDDIKEMQPFFDATKAIFINTPENSFPLNPLTFIDPVNENNKNLGIDKFVDIIARYSGLGPKQKGKLRDATKSAFLSQTTAQHPTLNDVNKHLLDEVGEDRDTLTEIMDDLCRYNVFEANTKDHFLNKNLYLSLSGDLAESVRFTSLFLIIQYIYNVFMNMENSSVENGIRAMRYVILIDEAHVIFKQRKYHDILEKMLREIRSKGVSVILLSQGIEEFDQRDFDFSTMCEIAFLMNIKNKNAKSMKKFLGANDGDLSKISRKMEQIKKEEAISNLKGHPIAHIFKARQFYKEASINYKEISLDN